MKIEYNLYISITLIPEDDRDKMWILAFAKHADLAWKQKNIKIKTSTTENTYTEFFTERIEGVEEKDIETLEPDDNDYNDIKGLEINAGAF